MILLKLSKIPKPISYPFNLLRFSFSSSKTLNPSHKPNLLTQYLISSCGFSQEKATKLSRHISCLTSPSTADSVRHFFKHLGFTDTQLRCLITGYPTILSADVSKTLQPNLDILYSMGFSQPALRKVITANPRVLVLESPLPRLNFWATLLNNNKRKMLAVFSRNRGLINHDVDRIVAPKIALLKKYGLSEADIGMIAVRGQRFITRSIESMKEVLKRARELGFNSESSMYGLGVSSVSSITGVRLEEKMEFFKEYGWSKEDFLTALKKAPFFIHLKEENVREKMEFLVGRAGCEQSYIASNPLLLMFSLEKRLKPRYYFMEFLNSNGVVRKGGLCTIIYLSEKNFIDQFVLRYKETLPEVHEIYVATRAGRSQFK